MNRNTNRIPGAVSCLAFLGGGGFAAYTFLGEYISPFIPLVITVVGSLIAGLLVRAFFVWRLNRKFVSSYRYT